MDNKLKARALRMKCFLGSTLGSLDVQLNKFLEENFICIGNYTDVKLFRCGDIYQLILVYAKVVDD